MKAQPPTGGDGIAVGEQLSMEESLGLQGGFSRLLKGTQADPEAGTQGVGVVLTTDRGYIFVPNGMASGNVTFTEWCTEEDILLLFPRKEGEGAFSYDAASDTLVYNPDEQDEVSCFDLDLCSRL